MKHRDALAEAMRRYGLDEETIQFAVDRMDLEMPSLANEEVPPGHEEQQIQATLEERDRLEDKLSNEEIKKIYDRTVSDLSSSN